LFKQKEETSFYFKYLKKYIQITARHYKIISVSGFPTDPIFLALTLIPFQQIKKNTI
jgi:hypothetical protein